MIIQGEDSGGAVQDGDGQAGRAQGPHFHQQVPPHHLCGRHEAESRGMEDLRKKAQKRVISV